MAAGPGLAEAVAELAALPRNAHERVVAGGIVLRLEGRLLGEPTLTPEEVIVRIFNSFEELEDHAEARGRREGLREGEALALLTLLGGRGIPVPDAARERILAERRKAQIERWIKRASVATSLADVLDARGRRRRAARG